MLIQTRGKVDAATAAIAIQLIKSFTSLNCVLLASVINYGVRVLGFSRIPGCVSQRGFVTRQRDAIFEDHRWVVSRCEDVIVGCC